VFDLLDYIIKKNDNKLYLSENNHYLVLDKTIQKYINSCLIKRFTNLAGVEKTTKRLFNFKSKVPLYVDENTLLMNIRSYRQENSMYINYFSILKYVNTPKEVIIHFYSGHCLKLQSRYSFIAQVKKCKTIIDYLQL
jgi:hypothetical protein